MIRKLLPFILLLLWAGSSQAAESRWLREVGVNVGYGTGPVNNGSYEFVTLLPRVGFDLGEALAKVDLRPAGTLEFVLEPLFNIVREPKLDYEGGAGLLFKYGYRLGRFLPYFEGGAGVVCMNDLVPEQSGGPDFIPQVGPGVHIFLTPDWTLTLSYRFRHLSNSGLTKPNHGVNSDLFLVGFSYVFESPRALPPRP
jgi:lipid A 3-O-deacylase